MPDTEDNDKDLARRWRERGQIALASARRLFLAGDVYGCANRAYYAVYQACVGTCVGHGDTDKFPADWNNPTHDQLPELIQNNGDFTQRERQTIKKHLNSLRTTREDSDYRVGRTVERNRAGQSLFEADAVFRILGVPIERGE